LSRLDADKMDLTIEPVALADIAREVARSLEPDANRKRITLRVDTDSIPIVVETDRLRIRQILVNVIANAIKFTSRGGVVVSVAEEDAASAKRRIVVDVTDSGIGVHPDQREHLFEPFGQANASIARMHGGSGLGLALSSRLAERLGGTLTLVSSELGKGSTFRLTLNKVPTRATPHNGTYDATGSTPPVQVRGVLEGLRVLLTDDNPDLQVAIGRVLKIHGAAVEYASDGREAVHAARSGRFDVLVMDMLMPHTNGLEAARTLRRDGYDVPIIAISADASPESRAAAADAGCDAYLSKPFEPSDLTSAIRFARRTPSDVFDNAGAK
jgi:CheY-like chemotaxis protein/two-component sensor histidine kinase